MKRLVPIFFFGSIFLISGVLFEQNISNSNTTGPTGGYSNAPGENNCTSCHSGTLNSGSGTPSITSNIPASGYIGGETYTITASIAESGVTKFGFQVSVENQSNSNIGSLIVTNSTQTKIVSTNYITHQSAGTPGNNSKTWTFNWKAPCAGQDTAIFYGTFNATNSSGTNAGDKIYATTLKVGENVINSSDSVSTITMADIADNYNGSDLRVQFKAADCETKTNQYRIMVVKQSSASSFDSTAAGQVVSANYRVVTTGSAGATKTTTLSFSATDVDGDAIQNNTPYKVFVYSAANTNLVNRSALVESLTSITLTSPMETVSNIKGFDIDDQGNGSDLEVTFNSPLKEATVAEYRTIVVKSSAAATFTSTAANALSSNRYVVTSTGNPGNLQTVNFTSTAMDSDGDPIIVNVPYTIFVLSKADGINSIKDTLQKSLTDITLGLHAAEVSSVTGVDISNNANGTDLEVTFQAAADETSVAEYRVIAVKVANAPAFGVSDANNLTSAQYVVENVGSSMSTITTFFNSTSQDSDGDLLVENEPYKVFVLSISDGTVATLNSLVESADTVTLVGWTTVGELANVDLSFKQYYSRLRVEVSGQESTSLSCTVYGINGQLISQKVHSEKQFWINLPSEHGIYLVELKTGQKRWVKKFTF
ncbi:MAG: choice-of-anchor V domain-containing protein [Vicingaceae bacterium]